MIGKKVYIPSLGLYGEVLEMSDKVKGLIAKVKVAGADGKYTTHEVADLGVDAVIVLRDIVVSQVFEVIVSWVKQLFRKRKK